MLCRRARSMERGADNDMHGDRMIPAERHLEVIALSGGFENDARPEAAPAIFSGYQANDRPDLAEAAGLIAWMVGNGPPFFSIGSAA
jgi:hypothetical protein